ncbi:hypothetical protein GGI42DRAFT_337876 [Trichoderma sp. SZMC 28013]
MFGNISSDAEDKDRAFRRADRAWRVRTPQVSIINTKDDTPASPTEGDVRVDNAEDKVENNTPADILEDHDSAGILEDHDSTDILKDHDPADILEDHDSAAIADSGRAATVEKDVPPATSENHIPDNADPDAKSSRNYRAASNPVATKSAQTPEFQQKIRNLKKLESTTPSISHCMANQYFIAVDPFEKVSYENTPLTSSGNAPAIVTETTVTADRDDTLEVITETAAAETVTVERDNVPAVAAKVVTTEEVAAKARAVAAKAHAVITGAVTTEAVNTKAVATEAVAIKHESSAAIDNTALQYLGVVKPYQIKSLDGINPSLYEDRFWEDAVGVLSHSIIFADLLDFGVKTWIKTAPSTTDMENLHQLIAQFTKNLKKYRDSQRKNAVIYKYNKNRGGINVQHIIFCVLLVLCLHIPVYRLAYLGYIKNYT